MPVAWKWGSSSHSSAVEWRGELDGRDGPISVRLRYATQPDRDDALELSPRREVASLALRISDRPARLSASVLHDPGHEGVETASVSPSGAVSFSLELEVAEGVSGRLERRVDFAGGAPRCSPGEGRGAELAEPWRALLAALKRGERRVAIGSPLALAAEFVLAFDGPLGVRERASQRVTLQVKASAAGVSARREGGGLETLELSSEPRGALEVGLHAQRLRRVTWLDRIEQGWIDDPGREVSLALPDWEGEGQLLERETDAEGRASLALRLESPMSGLLVARGRGSRTASACFEVLLRWGREVEGHLGRAWSRVDLPTSPDPEALRAVCAANLVACYDPDWHAFRDWSAWTPTLVGCAAHRRPREDTACFAEREARVSGPIDGWLLRRLPEPRAPAAAALWRACTAPAAGDELKRFSGEPEDHGAEAPPGEWHRGELWPLVDAVRAGDSIGDELASRLAARIVARPVPFALRLSEDFVRWELERTPVLTQSLAAALMARLGEHAAATALLEVLPVDSGRDFDRHATRFHMLAAQRVAIEAGLDRFKAHHKQRQASIWAALRSERRREFTADALLFAAAQGSGFLCYF